MTWHRASSVPSESRWTTSGSSANVEEPVRKTSNTGSLQQGDGEREPVGVGAAVPAGAGHHAHLAGADGQPAGVEVLPQRQGDFAVGVPGHFDDVPVVAHQLQGSVRSPSCEAEQWITMSQSGQGVVGVAEVDAERVRERALGRVDVDQLQPRERKTGQELGHHAADESGADHGDPVAQPGPGLPEAVDRRFPRCR